MNSSRTNFNNKNPSGDILSWVVVIICLAAFWPLGLILLLRKISDSTKGRYSSTVNPGVKYRQHPSSYQQASQSGYTSASRPYTRPAQTTQQQQSSAVRQPHYEATASTANTPEASHSSARHETVSDGKAAPGKKHAPSKGLAAALTALAVVLGLMGVIFLSSGLSALAVSGVGAANLGMTIFGAFTLLGAVISAAMRGVVLRRISRFNKYAVVIGGRDVMPISELSKTVGESLKKTRKSLQAMIDSGYFGVSAYIDSGLDSLVLSREAAEKAKAASGSFGTAEAPVTSGVNQFVTIVNELHMLCSQTSDPSICAKIARIEELTVKIFRIVEEKPEKLPQLRRFMNYYLPTTLKLLHSYQTLERQGINGENITAAKQDIERILNTLADGYEQQLDNLFKSDKLDISADITVLENLMEQDGLTNDGDIMRTAGAN